MKKYYITHVKDTPECDESVYKSRGRGPIEDDRELLEYAKEATRNYADAGHCKTFMTFSFIGYDIERKFTYKELVRIHEIQDREIEEYESLYGWENFKGKPLSEDVIIRFLDRRIERAIKQYGENDFWTKQAKEDKERKLKDWREGKVIEVDDASDAYTDRWLFSDGTTGEQHWGD